MEFKDSCNLCGDAPATLKLTLTNVQGHLLDRIVICKPCLDKFGSNLELQSGDVK